MRLRIENGHHLEDSGHIITKRIIYIASKITKMKAEPLNPGYS